MPFASAAPFGADMLLAWMTTPFSIPAVFGLGSWPTSPVAAGAPVFSATRTTTPAPDSQPWTSPARSSADSSGQPNGSSTAAVPQRAPANGAGPAHTQPRRNEAVASITLPDNTVYQITIPIADPLPFWPWSGGFGMHAASPPMVIDGQATDAASERQRLLDKTRIRRISKTADPSTDNSNG